MNSIAPLATGEKPIKNASPVQLGNGEQCIPQHYLLFAHTRQSVERVILNIEYNEKFLIFVYEDHSGIAIQIGVIGFDNFESLNMQKNKKVVYGRKWRVEPQLPTSEIIQTVFLAIKCAREHEVRELLKLNNEQRMTTPFNNHHDLPLMAHNSELVLYDAIQFIKPKDIGKALDLLSYDYSKFLLTSCSQLNNAQWLVELRLENTEDSQLPETKNANISLLLDLMTINEFYFQLMETLVAMSNRQVEENFRYLGFARFSRKNSIQGISKLSSTLRNGNEQLVKSNFFKDFEKTNYQTDTTRVPVLHRGRLATKLKKQLAKFGTLSGILPV